MATINYNYAFLTDSDVANNQSRGLSLQFNGYALLSGEADAITSLMEEGRVISMDDLVSNGVTVMFRDLQYASVNRIARSSDRNYDTALQNPGLHMFQDLKVMAVDEFKVIDETGYSSGQSEIEVPIYDTMFGNRLAGEADIIGVLLYGQAYNRDFYSEVQQGSIENSTPIGLIYFESGSQVSVNPSSSTNTKEKSVIKFLLGITASRDVTEMVMTESSASYQAWDSLRSKMHVVNENLLTTSSFVIHSHDIIPIEDESVEIDNEDGGAVLKMGPTIDVKSRLFFTNDIPNGNNFDHNVDYGSPARLTVLTSDQHYNDERVPQTMLGKVNYYSDEGSFKHAYIDGVFESYFTASGRREGGYKGNGRLQGDGKITIGSVFDFDWVSKNRPAFNLFSDETNYHFDDLSWCDYLRNGEPEGSSEIETQIRNNSACFARGVNLFSEKSSAVDGVNVHTRETITRGNAFCINSNRCRVFTRSPDEDEINRNSQLNKYTAFVANSQDVTIRDRVKGSNAPTDKYKSSRGKNNPLSMVLNSTWISIDNRASGLEIANTEKFGRNTVIGSHTLTVKNSDDNIFLGIKGFTYYKKSVEMCSWSHVENTKSSMFAGGYVYSNMANHCFVLSTGEKNTTQNRIEGYVDYDQQNPNNDASFVYDSVILGQNNLISSVYRYKPWNGNSSGQPQYISDEHQIFMVGKGLKNDVRQTMNNIESGEKIPTIVMGINNQDYYQKNKMKQLVIGGYRPYTDAYLNGDFHYNCAELSVTYPDPVYRNGHQNWNKETTWTLRDVKGRSVDYGSGAISLGFLKGVRSDQQFCNYSYKGYGRINLFKLYQLLKRMYWAPKGDGYVVKWKRNMGSDTYGGILKWSDFGENPNDTCFANLVDDNHCQYQYYPSKKPNS